MKKEAYDQLIPVRISKSIYEKLEKISKEDKIPKAALIRELVEAFVCNVGVK